jgi:hypothetical protein
MSLKIHTGDDKPNKKIKKKPSARSKAKGKEKKKRRLTKLEREFTQRWHAITDNIFDAAVEIWGDDSNNVWRDLAKAANVSYETVRRLGDRETRFPHLFTIDKLAQAVGGEILIEVNELKAEQIAQEEQVKRHGRQVA